MNCMRLNLCTLLVTLRRTGRVMISNGPGNKVRHTQARQASGCEGYFQVGTTTPHTQGGTCAKKRSDSRLRLSEGWLTGSAGAAAMSTCCTLATRTSRCKFTLHSRRARLASLPPPQPHALAFWEISGSQTSHKSTMTDDQGQGPNNSILPITTAPSPGSQSSAGVSTSQRAAQPIGNISQNAVASRTQGSFPESRTANEMMGTPTSKELPRRFGFGFLSSTPTSQDMMVNEHEGCCTFSSSFSTFPAANKANPRNVSFTSRETHPYYSIPHIPNVFAAAIPTYVSSTSLTYTLTRSGTHAGAAMEQRVQHSQSTKRNRVRFPASSLPDFRSRKSCWTQCCQHGKRRFRYTCVNLTAAISFKAPMGLFCGCQLHARKSLHYLCLSLIAALFPQGSGIPLLLATLAGQCNWSAYFLREIPFPPPLHSGAASSSPHFTLIGSQDIVYAPYRELAELLIALIRTWARSINVTDEEFQFQDYINSARLQDCIPVVQPKVSTDANVAGDMVFASLRIADFRRREQSTDELVCSTEFGPLRASSKRATLNSNQWRTNDSQPPTTALQPRLQPTTKNFEVPIHSKSGSLPVPPPLLTPLRAAPSWLRSSNVFGSKARWRQLISVPIGGDLHATPLLCTPHRDSTMTATPTTHYSSARSWGPVTRLSSILNCRKQLIQYGIICLIALQSGPAWLSSSAVANWRMTFLHIAGNCRNIAVSCERSSAQARSGPEFANGHTVNVPKGAGGLEQHLTSENNDEVILKLALLERSSIVVQNVLNNLVRSHHWVPVARSSASIQKTRAFRDAWGGQTTQEITCPASLPKTLPASCVMEAAPAVSSRHHVGGPSRHLQVVTTLSLLANTCERHRRTEQWCSGDFDLGRPDPMPRDLQNSRWLAGACDGFVRLTSPKHLPIKRIDITPITAGSLGMTQPLATPEHMSATHSCAFSILPHRSETLRHAKFALLFGIRQDFTVLSVLELASFLHWLLHRYETMAILTELHVIGTHNCEVFFHWCRVTQDVSEHAQQTSIYNFPDIPIVTSCHLPLAPELLLLCRTGQAYNRFPVPYQCICFQGATVAERLAGSLPTKANRAQSPAGSPDFRKWESCRTMPLVGGFSRGISVSRALSLRRHSIFTSITLIGSQDLAVKNRPNLATHTLI
ncbi:hypothetical protein PR048_030673 [Dryococelus australis]|uniref:Uncharacterized protein n=1 Tax=Dryococelus australis TaxID=614101 RepID=A0ABQ9G9K5_9NEOP|nr:hypothetical protein PR048_030673 [Dryococelus australis]